MKLLFDLFPVIVFFTAFKLADDPHQGVLTATAAAIVATLIQVLYAWIKHRRVEPILLVTLALIVILGGATLLLQDDRFIKWKPTAVNWLFAMAFLGSEFIGSKNLTQRMMAGHMNLPEAVWTRANLSWVIFFLVLGTANLYVAFNFATEVWVNFKLFGMLGLTLVFVFLQALYLTRQSESLHGKER
ncbi:MAG: septation protein A [Gammaproteobacteria bacterium]|nr:septation protein A [Gammaproteobacteria bacterium]